MREVSAIARKPPLKIWLDIGTREGPGIRQQTRSLRDLLTSKGWRLREDLWYAEVAQAEHNEYWWGARFSRVLRFLFPTGLRKAGID